jgi:hypothetical protein
MSLVSITALLSSGGGRGEGWQQKHQKCSNQKCKTVICMVPKDKGLVGLKSTMTGFPNFFFEIIHKKKNCL